LFVPDLADLAVVDARTPAGRRLADECSIPCVAINDADVEISELRPSRSRFTWRGHEVELPLGGAFNVANAVVAAEIVHALGPSVADVAGALTLASAVPGRFETVAEGQPFTVVVDYAHTPDGLEAVLETARAVTDNSLVVVFGAGGDRDATKRPQMGDVARRLADRVVVTDDNPRGEDPSAIVGAIVAGMATPPDLVEHDRRRAIRHALAGARAGDLVLVAGKGHETTQTIGDDVHDFDDRAVVREELRRLLENAS
jgi:UDP-N-acetylmuramoyl-L-alanyl-D-glutamate--2,6-diaminopimelate ligase